MRRRVGFGACFVAGIAAGLAAAAVSVVASALLGGTPPAQIAGPSAFVAGLFGGWLVLPLVRGSTTWMWAVCLSFATAMSLAVALLPTAFLPLPRGLIFLNGLAEPLGQVLQALGVLHHHAPAFAGGAASGARGPARSSPGARGLFLLAAITMHYLVAIATAAVASGIAGLMARPAAAQSRPA